MENTREIAISLDLNEEPPDVSTIRLGSLLNEIETAHGQIEERIRQLEAVTSRARQRHRWRQPRAPSETPNISVTNSHNDDIANSEEHDVAAPVRIVDECAKKCRRDGTHLIAKALAMDADDQKTVTNGGSFFDCNICLEKAKDPILTCCGHLFCWPCFYRLSYVHSNAKECPVCEGEVTDTNVTPIYGNGSKSHDLRFGESGLRVPPRPRAPRVESVRQQQASRGIYTYPIEEAMLLFSNRIAAMRVPVPQLDLDGAPPISTERTNFLNGSSTGSQAFQSTMARGSQHLPSARFSRLLSQGTASLTSLSSALSSAERLVEDLEAIIHSHHRRQSLALSPTVGDRDSFPSIASGTHLESQTRDNSAEINSTMAHSSSSSWRRSNVAAAAVLHFENQMTNGPIEINLAVPHSSSSSRRRTDVPRSSDTGSGASRAPRRRRLR
ncbi:uncharacterized protein LOC131165088 [Malania oleifera]|uniref:uncharacterized protein LOC131165088 n=1 Tax=Malania oleifera TaxID=397392 RepID=UPI0025ADAC97|nr:uncharacterized protein LOC131165088 [Malania oleifera]